MSRTVNRSGWRVMLAAELRRLWLGWRGPLLLFAFSLLLSIYTFLIASDPELNVVSQQRMIDWTIQLTVLVGMISVLLLSADSFSGERDQRSLESLLLTPVSGAQLAGGKLLAILSLWLAMLPIAVPYIALVSDGSDTTAASLLLLIVPGTLLVALSAGIGILVSGLSPTNLVSFAIVAAIFLILIAPTQLPGSIQELPFVEWFIVSNPITSVARYQSAVLEGEAWTTNLGLLASPFLILVLAVGPGLRMLDKRLSLQGGLRP